MSSFFIGIHGGASHGHVAVSNADGLICLDFETPPLALSVVENAAEKFTDLLRRLDFEMKSRSVGNLWADTQCIACGISGLHNPIDENRIRSALRIERFKTDLKTVIKEDVWVEMASAGVDSGILAMVATGINSFVRNASSEHFSIGGWGSELSDLGSGYYLGRLALRALLDEHDKRRYATPRFVSTVLDCISLSSATQIEEWYSTLRKTDRWRSAVADISRVVTGLAESEDDLTANRLLQNACDELKVSLLAAFRRANKEQLFKRSKKISAVLSGGFARGSLTAQAAFRQVVKSSEIHNETGKKVDIELVFPTLHPVAGAIALALTRSTKCPSNEIWSNIKASAKKSGLLLNWKEQCQ